MRGVYGVRGSSTSDSAPTKRKGINFWSIIVWCFTSHRHNKRISHALIISEPYPSSQQPAAAHNNHTEARLIVLPFVAPPPSPVSFYPSEAPSALQSPVNNMFSVSSGLYSPTTGPTNIFAIGPYANEPQLVSPPVFSNFTTEPSTAPLTPPPDNVYLTTPSSPEVPFARLLDATNSNSEVCQAFPLSQSEFHSYQYYPGSPVGQLISPMSGTSSSGTTSPFIDFENALGSHSLKFPASTAGHPNSISLDKKKDWGVRVASGTLTPNTMRLKRPEKHSKSTIGSGSVTPDSATHKKSVRDWGSKIGSGSLTPDTASRESRESCILDLQDYIRSHAHHISNSTKHFESIDGHVAGSSCSLNVSRKAEPLDDHRGSSQVSAKDVLKLTGKKQAASAKPAPKTSTSIENRRTSDDQMTQQGSLDTLRGSGSEFKFENTVNKNVRLSNKLKVIVEDGEATKGWPFFSTTAAQYD